MNFALKFFSDCASDSCDNVYLSIPEPLESRDPYALQYMPWRTYMAKYYLFIGILKCIFRIFKFLEMEYFLCTIGLGIQ